MKHQSRKHRYFRYTDLSDVPSVALTIHVDIPLSTGDIGLIRKGWRRVNTPLWTWMEWSLLLSSIELGGVLRWETGEEVPWVEQGVIRIWV